MELVNDIRFSVAPVYPDDSDCADEDRAVLRDATFFRTIAWILAGDDIVDVGRRCTIHLFRYRPDLVSSSDCGVMAAKLGTTTADLRALIASMTEACLVNAEVSPDIGRLADWIAEGRTLRDRGVRCLIAGHCLRHGPTSHHEAALRGLGRQLSMSHEGARKHVRSFSLTFTP